MDTEESMKKKVVSILCTLVLMLSLILSTGTEVKASDSMRMLDVSYLTRETGSIGTAVLITRALEMT